MTAPSVTAEFQEFAKIARLSRRCVITEKIDGTNAQVAIDEDGTIRAGSRNRWLALGEDNFGFAFWVHEHAEELKAGLGVGRHYGEWFGAGIQRKYDRPAKAFALFNTGRWNAENKPACCEVVPVLYDGLFHSTAVEEAIADLREHGSRVTPGFLKPEGVVIYHVAANLYFKKTLEKDEAPKGRPDLA